MGAIEWSLMNEREETDEGNAQWSKGMEECEMACIDERPGKTERWWKGI